MYLFYSVLLLRKLGQYSLSPSVTLLASEPRPGSARPAVRACRPARWRGPGPSREGVCPPPPLHGVPRCGWDSHVVTWLTRLPSRCFSLSHPLDAVWTPLEITSVDEETSSRGSPRIRTTWLPLDTALVTLPPLLVSRLPSPGSFSWLAPNREGRGPCGVETASCGGKALERPPGRFGPCSAQRGRPLVLCLSERGLVDWNVVGCQRASVFWGTFWTRFFSTADFQNTGES